MFYVLPRKDKSGQNKNIEGPSVRLAEIVASSWGNLRVQAVTIDIGEKSVTVRGMAHDLEKNFAASADVERRITTRDGRRYSDDMIMQTTNAAASIAIRNAIFKVVPFAYVKEIYEKAKRVAVGDAKTLESRRTAAFESFAKMGVREDRILARLEKRTVADVGLEDLVVLRGIFTAIRDNETTIDDAFPVAVAAQDLGEMLKSKAAETKGKKHAAKDAGPPEGGTDNAAPDKALFTEPPAAQDHARFRE